MIVKLVKPTALVDRVVGAGEFIDGDKLLERMVASGYAEHVLEGGAKLAKEEKPEQAETEKPVRSTRRKVSADKD